MEFEWEGGGWVGIFFFAMELNKNAFVLSTLGIMEEKDLFPINSHPSSFPSDLINLSQHKIFSWGKKIAFSKA